MISFCQCLIWKNIVRSIQTSLEVSGSLWKYYRSEPVLTNAGAITDFTAEDNGEPLKFLTKTNLSNSQR